MSGLYIRVWAALIGITLLEVALAWVRVAPTPMAVLLVALSIGKAVLIAWYFMHLKSERPRGVVALMPVLLLFAGALLMLLPDGFRAWTMRMP